MLLDADIRDPLFYYLESVYGKIRVLEEKVIGRARADFFMITENAFYGIEIKSDADTYARLKGQVREYDKYYDYNIAAVGASHLKHIHEHIPKYWGIIAIEEAEGRPVFSLVRQPQKNHKVKLVNKLGFLWRPELVQIQAMNDMPRYKEKSKAFVIKAIADRTQYPLDKLLFMQGGQMPGRLFTWLRRFMLMTAPWRAMAAFSAWVSLMLLMPSTSRDRAI